jgi:uncharacterized protein YodC (DUF2158 family)
VDQRKQHLVALLREVYFRRSTPEFVADHILAAIDASSSQILEWASRCSTLTMATNPKIGDRVQLSSGGPVMSVRTLPKDKHCVCNWFVGGQLQSDTFAVGQIVSAPKTKKKF